MTTQTTVSAGARFVAEAAAEDRNGATSILGAALCLAAAILVGEGAARLFADGDVQPPAGDARLFVTLLALAALAPALAVVLPLLHGRRFSGLWGASRRPQAKALVFGALAALGAGALMIAVEARLGFLAAAPAPHADAMLLLTAALLITAQATSEELFFRGYLLQATARLAKKSLLLWAAPSTLLFAALHYTPGAPLATLLWPLVFGAAAAMLVWRTGGISAGVGFHVAHNWIALLIFSEPGAVSGVGPLRYAEDAPRTLVFALEIAIAGAVLWLLWRRVRPEAT